MTKPEEYTPAEVENRFAKILRGAMHKPKPHKDVPHKGKEKMVRSSPSSAGHANGKTAPR